VRRFLIAVVVAALAVPAFAIENQNLTIFLDTDGDTSTEPVNEVCPPTNGTFDVFVCFGQFGDGGGMLGAAFGFERTFTGYKLTQTNLLGGLDFGDVEVDGWAITAGANCQYPDATGILVAAQVSYLYLGVPGSISVVPHPIDLNSAADCLNELDFWCVPSVNSHGLSGNFGVCTVAPDGNCEPTVPTEDRSWGSIKALYH